MNLNKDSVEENRIFYKLSKADLINLVSVLINNCKIDMIESIEKNDDLFTNTSGGERVFTAIQGLPEHNLKVMIHVQTVNRLAEGGDWLKDWEADND